MGGNQLMGRIRKFLHLSRDDKKLLMRATWLLWVCRLGLWLVPFKALRRYLANVERGALFRLNAGSIDIDRIIWAVAMASRYVPAATCLTQALAGQVLLKQHCAPAHLRIGVMKNDRGALQAHAWIESEGRVVIGKLPDLAMFTELPSAGKLI
jgi:hypothetical protein